MTAQNENPALMSDKKRFSWNTKLIISILSPIKIIPLFILVWLLHYIGVFGSIRIKCTPLLLQQDIMSMNWFITKPFLILGRRLPGRNNSKVVHDRKNLIWSTTLILNGVTCLQTWINVVIARRHDEAISCYLQCSPISGLFRRTILHRFCWNTLFCTAPRNDSSKWNDEAIVPSRVSLRGGTTKQSHVICNVSQFQDCFVAPYFTGSVGTPWFAPLLAMTVPNETTKQSFPPECHCEEARRSNLMLLANLFLYKDIIS